MVTDSQTAEYIQTTALSTGRRRLSWTTLSSSTVRVFPLNARSRGLVVAAGWHWGCDSPDSCEIPVTTWEPGKDVSQRKVFRAARTGGEGAAHNASRRDPRRASRASQYVLVPARRLRLISVAEWGWLCLSREAGGSCPCCIAARGPDVIKAFWDRG